MVVLLGETGVTKDEVNFEQIARDVAEGVGFTSEASGLDCFNMQVI
jgi:S-adenosylmethionine synthetase